MSDRDLMQQALNALQGLADYRYTKPVETTMKALNERLAHCDRCGKRLGGEGDIHTCTPDPIGDAQDKLIAEMAAQPEQKPIGYLFQHEETGLTTIVDVQQVEWGFEKNNPRHQKIGPVYTTPPAAPVQEPVADAMARYLRVCSTGGMPEELQKSVQSLFYDAERLGYFKAATAPAP